MTGVGLLPLSRAKMPPFELDVERCRALEAEFGRTVFPLDEAADAAEFWR